MVPLYRPVSWAFPLRSLPAPQCQRALSPEMKGPVPAGGLDSAHFAAICAGSPPGNTLALCTPPAPVICSHSCWEPAFPPDCRLPGRLQSRPGSECKEGGKYGIQAPRPPRRSPAHVTARSCQVFFNLTCPRWRLKGIYRARLLGGSCQARQSVGRLQAGLGMLSALFKGNGA